jgi:hypothetical protein
MCDYSLESVQSRPAKVGDRLTTRSFTRGFSAPENKYVAVCLRPGTELSFANEVKRIRLWPWNSGTIKHKTATLSNPRWSSAQYISEQYCSH